MSEETTQIRVNFGKPFPLFPLDGVVLLPHALLKLFIFEPRYRQMIADTLDSAGQIAMAVFKDDEWKHNYHGSPPIRRAVCVGQIVQHEQLPDGNYRVLLHGVCRATIAQELPCDGEVLYRRAMLDANEKGDPTEKCLGPVRESMLELLRSGPLNELAAAHGVLRELESREIPTAALIEVLTLSVLHDKRVQCRLLAQGDVRTRASIVEGELNRIRGIMLRAKPQWDPDAPSGVTWN